MQLEKNDIGFIDNFELSVLKLSETIDEKIAEVSSRAAEANAVATQSAYAALEALKAKQMELASFAKRLRDTIKLQ